MIGCKDKVIFLKLIYCINIKDIMSKERLSKLQRIILEVIAEESHEENPFYDWRSIYEKSREKYGLKPDDLKSISAHERNLIRMVNPNPIWYDWSLKSSFSRSIRNLEKKGFVVLKREFLTTYWENNEMKDLWYQGSRKVSDIELTRKGRKLIKSMKQK